MSRHSAVPNLLKITKMLNMSLCDATDDIAVFIIAERVSLVVYKICTIDFIFVQGTTRFEFGGQEVADCEECSPGYYCSETGLVSPSGPCAAGHYCLGATNTSHPMVSVIFCIFCA